MLALHGGDASSSLGGYGAASLPRYGGKPAVGADGASGIGNALSAYGAAEYYRGTNRDLRRLVRKIEA